MPIERTRLGNPFAIGFKPRKAVASQNQNITALSNMAALGAGAATMIANTQEATAVMDAQNDLVNDSINPDKEAHQSAYAWSIADGEAREHWQNQKTRIESGEFDNDDPNDFQQSLKDANKDYYKKWEGNSNSAGAIGAYNKFMVDNTASLTASQAGRWRIQQGENQSNVLRTSIAGMAKDPNTTVDQFITEIEAPKYTMVDPVKRSQVALLGAADQAAIDGDSSVLKALDEKYGYSVDPKMDGTYAAALKMADRKKNALSVEEQYQKVALVGDMVDQGIVTTEFYTKEAINWKDAKGNQLYTPKQWAALVRKSKIKFAENNTKNNYKIRAEHGDDLIGATGKDFDGAMKSIFVGFATQPGSDVLKATTNIGRILGRQTSHKWSELSAKTSSFNNILSIVDGKPNPEFIEAYKAIEALETGMKEYVSGEKIFSSYLGDSLIDYIAVKTALGSTLGTSSEETWNSVTQQLIGTKKEAERQTVISNLSDEGKALGESLAESMYENKMDVPLIPGFLERSFRGSFLYSRPGNYTGSAATTIAVEYDKGIAMGFSKAVSAENAKEKANGLTEMLGGRVVTTGGVKLTARLGTAEHDAAMKSFYKDPMYSIELLDMYSKTSNKTFLDYTDIEYEINTDDNTLEFRGIKADELFYAVPLRDIGLIHEAKNNDVANIQNLERLYGNEFLSTDEGREWHDEQADLNSKFLTEVLKSKSIGDQYHDLPTRNDYVELSEKDKTFERMKFHRENYEGAIGRGRQIRDFFKLKLDADTPTYINIHNYDDRHRYPIEKADTKPMNTITIDRAKDLIKKHEGLRLTSYKDLNKQAIGYGHNLTKGEDLTTISRKDADVLFNRDFDIAYTAAKKIPTFNKINDTRKTALIDLSYNMGGSWYKKFPKFMDAMKKGNYDIAADELVDSKWYKQVGNRADTIVKMIREG